MSSQNKAVKRNLLVKVAFVLVIAEIGLMFEFVATRADQICPPSNGEQTECLPAFNCEAFPSRQALLSARPKPCFPAHQTELHICCPIRKRSLYQCGNSERVIYEQLGPATLSGTFEFKKRTHLPQNLQQTPTQVDSKFFAQNFSQLFSQRTQAQVPQWSDVKQVEVIERPDTVVAQAVGGVNARLGKWPWMALFGRWNNSELSDWFCGGTLISPDYVLTAAHCIGSASEISAGVRLGDHDLFTKNEVDHQDRHIARVIFHEEYRGSQNDIALVQLRQPAQLNDAVMPICLPDAASAHTAGLPVSMAGWGLLQFRGDETPHVLQEVALQLADIGQCEAAYRQLPSFSKDFPGGFQNTKLCAVSRDDEIRGACTGDSGGPLMRQSSTDGIYELIGVVSTGVGCGHPDYPGVYTRVSAYIDWIKRNSHGIF